MTKRALLITVAAAGLLFAGCAVLPRAQAPETIYRPGGPWLGIVGRGTGGGVEVLDVYVGSPAEEAGLKRGDIVEAAGAVGRPADAGGLLSALEGRRAGEVLPLTVSRAVGHARADIAPGGADVAPEELPKRYREILEGGKPGQRLTFRAERRIETRSVTLTLAEAPARVRQVPPAAEETVAGAAAGWLGIAFGPAGNLSAFGLPQQAQGLRITSVSPSSPAAQADLRPGDVILRYGGEEVGGDEAGRERFRSFVKEAGSGAEVPLRILRVVAETSVSVDGRPLQADLREPDALAEAFRRLKPGEELQGSAAALPKILNVNVTLGTRAAARARGRLPAPTMQVQPEPSLPPTPVEELAARVLAGAAIKDKYDDLLKRFADDEQWDDGFRLADVARMKGDPFRIPKVSGDLLASLRGAAPHDAAKTIRLLAERVQPEGARPAKAPVFLLRTGLSLEEHADQFVRLLGEADRHRKKAFSGLTEGDLEFLGENLAAFAERWSRDLSLSHPEEIKNRGEIDKRVLTLLGYVDYAALFEAAEVIASVVSPDFLNGLKADLKAGAQGREGVVLRRDTPFGPILFGGKGKDRYETPAAVIVDLGGDDFYGAGAAATPQNGLAFSVLVDFEGNDRYSSSDQGAQGAGILGVGLLAELGGNDTYIAQGLAQGSGIAGVGILLDVGGGDGYQAKELAQGGELFGIGMVIDRGPEADSYRATKMAQGFGGPGGAGFLFDEGGDDRYFASGEDPSSYGENVGTFDGRAQGCGTGIRCHADWTMSRSGGLGILIDGQGDDRYEAGTFSQGGGYFFGWGLLLDGGQGNDDYLGTRYAQGFAAHSAIGYFEDEGGNDRYRSQVGVIAGAAWDLSAVAFVDRGGDDVYEGGFFSLGASAHNGFCLFMELGGKDTYLGTSPGEAGPNDYHGGTSLSVFANEGPGEKTCPACPAPWKDSAADAVLVRPEHSVLLRTNGTVEALLAGDRWKAVLQEQVEEGSAPARKDP
jgi:hypothetical protein